MGLKTPDDKSEKPCWWRIQVIPNDMWFAEGFHETVYVKPCEIPMQSCHNGVLGWIMLLVTWSYPKVKLTLFQLWNNLLTLFLKVETTSGYQRWNNKISTAYQPRSGFQCWNNVRISTSYQLRSGFQPNFNLMSTKVRISTSFQPDIKVRISMLKQCHLTSTKVRISTHFNLISTKIRVSTLKMNTSKLMITFYNWILNQIGIYAFSMVCNIINIQMVIFLFSHNRLKIFIRICMYHSKWIITKNLMYYFYDDNSHIGQKLTQM